jgi:hypothetical protein
MQKASFIFASAAMAALVAGSVPAAAAGKCETKTQTCTDVQSGLPRTCIITTCTDDDGKVVSTDILVLKEAEPKPAAPKMAPVGVIGGGTLKRN